MIDSITDLYNMALKHVGAGKISSPNDGSEEAIACNQFFRHVLDEVLQAHPWSCAASRARLSEIDGETLSPFTYRYQLPVDPFCLKVLSLIDAEGEAYEDVQEPWEKEGHSIYCNLSPCAIRFTRRVPSVKDLDTHVAETVSYKLAAAIAFPITKDAQNEARLIQLYLQKLPEAKAEETFVAAGKKRPLKRWEDIH